MLDEEIDEVVGEEPGMEPGGREEVVNFYFPVEVVVVGGLSESDRDLLEAQIWEHLHDAIERTT